MAIREYIQATAQALDAAAERRETAAETFAAAQIAYSAAVKRDVEDDTDGTLYVEHVAPLLEARDKALADLFDAELDYLRKATAFHEMVARTQT